MSLSLSLPPSTALPHLPLAHSLLSRQQFIFCQSSLLLINLFIPSLPPLVRKRAEVFEMISFSPPGLCVLVWERVLPGEWPLLPRELFKKPRAPSKSCSDLTIHQMNNKLTIAKFQYFHFLFFFLRFHKCHFTSTAERSSLLHLSLPNNTFCFWDQLVGGWPLFSPPGASTRHAGPGPEPRPGREPAPRRWHTDRQSGPLAGHGFCPGQLHLDQDTEQIGTHTQRERDVKG